MSVLANGKHRKLRNLDPPNVCRQGRDLVPRLFNCRIVMDIAGLQGVTLLTVSHPPVLFRCAQQQIYGKIVPPSLSITAKLNIVVAEMFRSLNRTNLQSSVEILVPHCWCENLIAYHWRRFRERRQLVGGMNGSNKRGKTMADITRKKRNGVGKISTRLG
ncbi:hypothetical protein EAF00_002205 [Botryotinia globosa]|nr:hypothetical protein EAF00_002205 [Botryotinia globosa]